MLKSSLNLKVRKLGREGKRRSAVGGGGGGGGCSCKLREMIWKWKLRTLSLWLWSLSPFDFCPKTTKQALLVSHAPLPCGSSFLSFPPFFTSFLFHFLKSNILILFHLFFYFTTLSFQFLFSFFLFQLSLVLFWLIYDIFKLHTLLFCNYHLKMRRIFNF